MKVTAVETLHADRFMYVKVSTDDGIVGWGELHPASGTGGTPYLPKAGVEYCAEYLVGENPLEIEKHWQHMFRRCLFRGGSDVMAAIGAIDIALWDIKGKAYGKPVYELLGGPTREKVRLYTHLGGSSKEELVEQAKARVEEGFTAVRLYPFGDFGGSFAEGRGLEQMSFTKMQHTAVEQVGAVREAVGPDVDVMIDVVNRLTPAEAIAVGRALEPFNLYFFEDPIEPENMDQWGYVAENVPMPLAMGERLYTIYQFRERLLIDDLRLATVLYDLGSDLVRRLAPVVRRHPVNHRAHQLAQQEVSVQWLVHLVRRHQVVLQSRLGARRSDEPRLVRVVVVDVDNGVIATLKDMGRLELEVPALVPAERQPRQVVPLDQHPRHAPRLTVLDHHLAPQPVRLLQRRAQVRKPEPRHRLDSIPYVIS